MGNTQTPEELVNEIQTGAFQKWLESMLPEFMSFLWCVILALIVFFIGIKIVKLCQKLLKKTLDYHDVETSLALFLLSVVKWVGYILLLILILGVFGITSSSIAAAVAAVGVTAGLSLQGALANFAGGCLIMLMHPFKIGDYIKEDTNGNEGTVSNISIIYTTLMSIDGKHIVVPNGALANASLTNYTSNGKRMFNEVVGISYDSDVKKAKEILLDIAQNDSRVFKDSDIKVFVGDLGDSSVNVGLRFWVSVEDFWQTKWDILEEIKERFDAEGVEICFNQLDVHIDNK